MGAALGVVLVTGPQPVSAAVDVYGRDISDESLNPLPEPVGIPQHGAPTLGGRVFGLTPFVYVPVGSSPDAVAIGDVTGDGLPDAVMSTASYFDPGNDYSLFVFGQNAAGGLRAPVRTAYNQTATRNGLAIINADGTHAADIVVGGGSGITLLRSNGAGGHVAMPVHPGVSTTALVPIGLDGDVWEDILVTGWSNGGTQFRSEGNGTFASSHWPAVNQGWTSIARGDLDGDADEDDVALASGQGSTPHVRLYRNDDGALVEFHAFGAECGSWAPRGVGIGDIDSDGDADIVLSAGGNSPSACLLIVRGQGAGTFAVPEILPTYDIPETLRVVDLNRDRRADIVVLHGGWNAMSVYLQEADGTLSEPTRYPIPYASHYNFTHGMEVGDLNADGCPDIAIADYNQGLVTLNGQNCTWVFGHGFE